jgi:membrane fusion protein, multidrug efflux system
MNAISGSSNVLRRGAANRPRRIAIAVASVFAVLFAIGLVPRLVLQDHLAADAAAARDQLPIVATASPRRADAAFELPLPGTLEAILETGIWARTDGYLRSRSVDIGDRVTQGQLLAEIDTPEIDQQLQQAIAVRDQDRAHVVRFEADLALARTTLERFLAAGVGAVSKEQIDQQRAAETDAEKIVDAGRATVNADEANVQRLLELQSFQKVYAPFDGVVTVRNVDPGSLISAGSTSGTTELFRIAQVDMLRVFVFVPQSYAPDIQVGQKASVSLRERPDQTVMGTVTRTAGAVDPSSRTLRTELEVPNPDGLLLAGSYATVHFQIAQSPPALLVPSSALLVDAQGMRVAVVDGDHRLHYRPVQIGRDYGQEVEVLSGVAESEILATGLSAAIGDGSAIEIAKPAGVTGK